MGPLLLSASLPEQEVSLLIDLSVYQFAAALVVFAVAQAILWRYVHKIMIRLIPLWSLLVTVFVAFMMFMSASPYDGIILLACTFFALPCEAAGLICGVLWKRCVSENRKDPSNTDK